MNVTELQCTGHTTTAFPCSWSTAGRRSAGVDVRTALTLHRRPRAEAFSLFSLKVSNCLTQQHSTAQIKAPPGSVHVKPLNEERQLSREETSSTNTLKKSNKSCFTDSSRRQLMPLPPVLASSTGPLSGAWRRESNVR